jgi:hypothetical protein
MDEKKSDVLVIAHLVAGASAGEAASAAGISLRTVQRRQKDPNFQAARHELERRILDQVVCRMSGLCLKAIMRLEELLDSDSETVALRAVQIVLDRAPRLRADQELETRIAALEEDTARPTERGAYG